MYYITSWGTQRFQEEKRKMGKKESKGEGKQQKKGMGWEVGKVGREVDR